MPDPIAFANGFAALILILHPIIYLALRLWPDTYVWVVKLALFGIEPRLTDFDFSFKNMVVGTIVKAIGFWIFGFLLFSLYGFFLSL